MLERSTTTTPSTRLSTDASGVKRLSSALTCTPLRGLAGRLSYIGLLCLVLLPISLLLPYLAWRTRSWGAGIVLHGLGNVLLFAILIPSVQP